MTAVKSPIRIRSVPVIESAAGQVAGPKWMALLESLGTTSSIAAAAKKVGLSYKAAWDAIDALNNFFDQPLVTRIKGGRGGGGSTLTPQGRALVATFKAVEAENARALDAVNARLKGAEHNLQIIGRMALLTSARNHFAGKVVKLTRGAVNDEVQVELAGGERIIAIVTRESTESLELKPARPVIALIKASSILIATESEPRLKLSARNQLRGIVKRITRGAVNSEVVVELKGGVSAAAIITNASVKALKLAKGKSAVVIFKASSVILGVSA